MAQSAMRRMKRRTAAVQARGGWREKGKSSGTTGQTANHWHRRVIMEMRESASIQERFAAGEFNKFYPEAKK